MSDLKPPPADPGAASTQATADLSVNDHLGHRLRVLVILAASVLLDGAVMLAWVVVNWCLDRYVIEPMRLHGADQSVLVVMRFVFGMATLVAVLAFVVEDLIAIIVGVVRRIRSGK